MKPDKFKEEVEDIEVEEALRNFRLSFRYWSEQEFVRPRVIEISRWSRFKNGFWRMIANPALGGTLAAVLLITSVGVPLRIQHERAVETARQAALDQQKKEMQRRLAEEEAMKSVASDRVDDGAFLDDVDSDISQATPDAMQPLASLMSDGPSSSKRR